MTAEWSVATFFTTHAALAAEKAALAAGVSAKLIPSPRSLSADCTLALRFPSAESDRVRGILSAHAIEAAGVHRLDNAARVADTSKCNEDR
jgi:hypothetical protein